MSDLELSGIRKNFGDFVAMHKADLFFEAGKLTALLGPSGCGKTTLLRMIAGLEAPSEGQILLGGKDIASLSAEQRKFGMVFQSFALFPHLNVARNVSYSLRIAGVDALTRRARARELLELVQLADKGNNRIGELSGGQQQRVAIARALAQEPVIFLLDEPMSALDAQLRNDMQMELRLLQQRLGITTIVVTHDQREAMTIADKIVVMSQGRIEQVGTPQEIYHKPANGFVASFIGNANLLDGRATNSGVTLGDTHFAVAERGGFASGDRVTLFCRPEAVRLTEVAPSGNALKGMVTFVRDEGIAREIHLDTGAGHIIAEIPGSFNETIRIGDRLHAEFPVETLHLLPARPAAGAA
ncbi:ABC transporter ATP-binding protein [Pelagibius litoralis]|uniref:ABC transporter ATP-binding protein n=1 Tax=Pelagibius litoralis TaxID=374515 RepID=A0A967EZR0_9PROT|nr:ABC transporter ATP-binding protein [Pelagibius litoralis]NIA70369.1 ABC transporter ATP-binding protein [Pelagibius litoralis]